MPRPSPTPRAPPAAPTAKRYREAKVLTAERVARRLADFVAARGRMPTTREDQVLHRKLAELRRDRAALAPAVVAALEAVPGWQWAPDAPLPSELTAQRLSDFLAANGGRYPGNTRSTPKDEVNLNKVIAKYRRQYGRLTPRDRAAFEAVPGWTWNVPAPPTAATAAAVPVKRRDRSAPSATASPSPQRKAPRRAPPSAAPSPAIARLRTEDLPSLSALRASPSAPSASRSADRGASAVARLRTEELPSLSAYGAPSAYASRSVGSRMGSYDALIGSLGASPLGSAASPTASRSRSRISSTTIPSATRSRTVAASARGGI